MTLSITVHFSPVDRARWWSPAAWIGRELVQPLDTHQRRGRVLLFGLLVARNPSFFRIGSAAAVHINFNTASSFLDAASGRLSWNFSAWVSSLNILSQSA